MRRVVRSGRKYVSVRFFCGRWDCPRCAPKFRQRWIKHIQKVASDESLYTYECSEADWSAKVRRAVNRLHGEYVKIRRADGTLTIILTEPLKGSTPLEQDDLPQLLDTAIPINAKIGPVSTSRGWEQQKNTKKDTDYKLVVDSWLPTVEQRGIAAGMGATIDQYNRWTSPETADDKEWAESFKTTVRSREKELDDLILKGISTDLRKQYAEDNLNDHSRKFSHTRRFCTRTDSSSANNTGYLNAWPGWQQSM